MHKERPDFKNFSKKELKDYVNEHGFFSNALIDRTETNAPAGLKDQIPEGAMYFKAIASNGDLNRNGYIIREKAFKAAIQQYMENPVILLQHDMNQPVGRVLRANGGQEGIQIEGYIYDEYTNNRFSKGLFNAVSTGHLTEGLEFQNETTNEVITEEEFQALPWKDKSSGAWVMAVTALDWLENSIVSIGANRKSLVKNKDLVKNYVEALKNEAGESDEEKKKKEEEAKAKEEKEKQEALKNNQIETKKSEDATVVVETPPAPIPAAENAAKVEESKTIEVSTEEVKQVNEALMTLANLAKSQNAEIVSLKTQVESLKTALNNIPVRKGLIFAPGSPKAKEEPKKNWLGELFEANGLPVN